ncbi:aspartate/glutamate racemase family protein [Thermodesulfobacteriota bacterium]
MKLIVIPPYNNPEVNMGYVISDLLEKLKKRNGFEEDEIDMDEGQLLESQSHERNAAFLAKITPGFLEKVKFYSESGVYDAIASSGFLDPGFEAARTFAKIPVAGALHSSLHMASLIGKRASVITGTIPLAHAGRQIADSYGLGHKLVSLRPYGHSTTELFKLIDQYEDHVFDTSEAERISENIVQQCVTAIETDRADALILGCEPTEFWGEEIRRRLDAKGYEEIPLIAPTLASIQMAKSMAAMQLKQTPRAYPTDDLKAKPEYA